MVGHAQYIFRRSAQALLTIFIASTLTFFILRLLPGDPTTLFADAMMTPEIRQKLLADFGLDQPVPIQYAKFLYQLAQGNLGMSISQRAPVSTVISDALPWTLLLAGSSLILTLVISICLGLITIFRRGGIWDLIIRASTVTLGALFIPWVALMVMYFFGRQLNWLPIGGATDPQAGEGWDKVVDIFKHLVLPCLVLTLTNLGPLVLFLRTSMVEVMQEDFIRTGRAKGVTEKRVILVHALRNALIPFATVVGLRLGFLVSGAVLTETVFAYPGIGRLIFRSVQQHDYPVLQGAFLMLAITVVFFNLLTDLVYGVLDPRISNDRK